MAWEHRGGGVYYYRKRRDGDKVTSRYIGSGALAELAAGIDALKRQEAEAERERWRREVEAQKAIDRELDAIGDQIRTLVAASLLAAGYHRHRGTWRRRRDN